ncbi:MAG TPA: NUDIX hydrolase [Streptosporangiaceae bacterium]|nr:NUDIX hydrolase [Streptosporangiaceae bacterium]
MTGTPADRSRTFVEPERWYAQLATHYAATGALITDPEGRILLVKPYYRDHWTLPGGMVDHGETPESACAREITEELGVNVVIGRLLVIDWAPAHPPRPRPITYFLFDAGVLTDASSIHLQEAELDACCFVDPLQAAGRLAAHTAARLPAALAARSARTTLYLPQETGSPATMNSDRWGK